jgi:PTS system glucitol/sorbitol-specific IIA component
MTILYRTRISEIGSEVGELLEGGVLILFREGAPPELAEVAVLHQPEVQENRAPEAGDTVAIGGTRLQITAVGSTAWAKALDLGHVTFSFSGAEVAERPGEVCVRPCPAETLAALLLPGAMIEVVGK